MSEQPRYHSYLLRMWLAGDDQAQLWRIMLEDAQTSERRGFSSLEELFIFLKEEIGEKTGSQTIERKETK